MKAFAVVCLFVVGAAAQYGTTPAGYGSSAPSAAPASYGVSSMPSFDKPAPVIPILSYTQSITGGVSDSHSFSTGNGIQESENTQVVPGSGHLYEAEDGKMVKSDSSLVKSGSVSYTSPEGTPISLSYTADEDGFKPSGSHLPVAPAVPPMPQELAAAYAKAASDYNTAAAAAAASPDRPDIYNAPAAPAYAAPAAPAYSAPAPLPVVRMQTTYSGYTAPAPVAPVAPQQEIRMNFASAPAY